MRLLQAWPDQMLSGAEACAVGEELAALVCSVQACQHQHPANILPGLWGVLMLCEGTRRKATLVTRSGTGSKACQRYTCTAVPHCQDQHVFCPIQTCTGTDASSSCNTMNRPFLSSAALRGGGLETPRSYTLVAVAMRRWGTPHRLLHSTEELLRAQIRPQSA